MNRSGHLTCKQFWHTTPWPWKQWECRWSQTYHHCNGLQSAQLPEITGTAHCLDSYHFSQTTSFLIHKNNFGTSLDCNKIFSCSKCPCCANVLTKQRFESLVRSTKIGMQNWSHSSTEVLYMSQHDSQTRHALWFYTCSLVAGKDPNSLMYLSVSLASWLVYCCFCCLKPKAKF